MNIVYDLAVILIPNLSMLLGVIQNQLKNCIEYLRKQILYSFLTRFAAFFFFFCEEESFSIYFGEQKDMLVGSTKPPGRPHMTCVPPAEQTVHAKGASKEAERDY
jgi:hypothetical protein